MANLLPKNPSPDELDHLLARGGLSGARREQILERVLAVAAPARERSWTRLWVTWVTGGSLAAAAAGMLFFMRTEAPSFRVKGATPVGARIEATCLAKTPGRCTRGDTLAFSAEGATKGGTLAAYATRKSDSEVIWYFPDASGHEPELVKQSERQVIPKGVLLGPEHTADTYLVHMILSSTPVSRADVLAGHGFEVVAQSTTIVEVAR